MGQGLLGPSVLSLQILGTVHVHREIEKTEMWNEK